MKSGFWKVVKTRGANGFFTMEKTVVTSSTNFRVKKIDQIRKPRKHKKFFRFPLCPGNMKNDLKTNLTEKGYSNKPKNYYRLNLKKRYVNPIQMRLIQKYTLFSNLTRD